MAKGKNRRDKDLPLFDLPLRDTDEIETGGALELDPPEAGFEDARLDGHSQVEELEDGFDDRGADADLEYEEIDDGPYEEGSYGDDSYDEVGDPDDAAYDEGGELDDAGYGDTGYDEDGAYEGEVTEVVADPPAPAQRGLFEHLEEDHGHGEDDDDLELGEVVASPVDRLLAGIADLGVHGALLALTAGGCVAVGVPVTLDDWPPFAGLALVLSFLYWIIPLAFWGQTPGMAWIGTAARSEDDEPLSFGQAVLRWIGALSTAALGGLPLLMALGGGRSLSDRMSDSKTLAL